MQLCRNDTKYTTAHIEWRKAGRSPSLCQAMTRKGAHNEFTFGIAPLATGPQVWFWEVEAGPVHIVGQSDKGQKGGRQNKGPRKSAWRR